MYNKVPLWCYFTTKSSANRTVTIPEMWYINPATHLLVGNKLVKSDITTPNTAVRRHKYLFPLPC